MKADVVVQEQVKFCFWTPEATENSNVMPGETASKAKLHCVQCGRPETKNRTIDAQYHCDECRKNVPQIRDLNIGDASSLSDVSFGQFKSWLNATIKLAFQEELNVHVENLRAEIKTVSTELSTTKKELTTEKNRVTEQKKTIDSLKAEVDDLKKSMKDTTKYLLNVDRNSRQHNAVLFGVPEQEMVFPKEAEDDVVAKDDTKKVEELLKVVEFSGKLKQHVRLGAEGERPRPIKLVFHSPLDASSAISNSGNLKNLANQTIFIKPDKSKSENAEFKRVGDKKKELLKKYPNVEGQPARVVLKKGVLTLDGVEVTRYTPIQTLF